jgi:anion transporter
MRNIDFSKIPLFAGLDRVELAKLIPSLVGVRYEAGTLLVEQGEPGDAMYLILEGEVEVLVRGGSGEIHEVATLGPGMSFGEMALLTGEPRSADVRTLTDLKALRLSREDFHDLMRKQHSQALYFTGVLAQRLAIANDPDTRKGTKQEALDSKRIDHLKEHDHHHGPSDRVKIMIGAAACILCLIATGLLYRSGVAVNHIILFNLLIGATVFWTLDTIPYHAISIALPLLAVMFGVASPEKAFSGFSKPYWFLALGVFALSAAVLHTGLLYRLALHVMLRFPPNYYGQTFGIALAGLLLTPIIPSANSRSILASPIALTLSETLQMKRGTSGTIGVAMSCLLGFGHMSFMFMNGTASCVFVLGLMPDRPAGPVGWGSWLQASLPLGILFFLLSYLAVILLYRPRDAGRLHPEVVDAQLRTLGVMTGKEKVALTTLLICILGLATEQLHHIDEAWIAMFGFVVVFAASVLEEKSIRSDIDWSFLIALGAMVGFGDILVESGFTSVVVAAIKPYLVMFSGSKVLLLVIFSLTVHLIRFALPLTPGLLVSMLAIMPVLTSAGIDPFVVALVALLSSNPWVLRHQNSVYRNVWKATGGKLFAHEDTLKIALLHIAIVAVSVAAAVPYWTWLGLIR